MSPLGVVVLEGEDKGLPEARRLLGKLWDGRSDICWPSGLEVKGGEDRGLSQTHLSGWLLFRFVNGV